MKCIGEFILSLPLLPFVDCLDGCHLWRENSSSPWEGIMKGNIDFKKYIEFIEGKAIISDFGAGR